MNKTHLIEVVANETNLKKKDAEAAVNSVLNAIANALADGEKVQIAGFGTFEVKARAERVGRNRYPCFQASRFLRRQGTEGKSQSLIVS